MNNFTVQIQTNALFLKNVILVLLEIYIKSAYSQSVKHFVLLNTLDCFHAEFECALSTNVTLVLFAFFMDTFNVPC
jgi:hypothetical protein